MSSYPLKILLVLLLTSGSLKGASGIGCPPFVETPSCSCFVLEDQLNVQCSGSDLASFKKSLEALNGPVKTFSDYDLDPAIKSLPPGFTDNVTSPIYHLQLSHTSLEDLEEGSLDGLRHSLESLAIISGHLHVIPSTLASLGRLKSLDLEGNLITTLPAYAFHDFLVQKVSLKGNLIKNISEFAFWGLEETLMDIDLAENKLKEIPWGAISRLRLLNTLSLQWNEITEISGVTDISWPLLKTLNLNSNFIKQLAKGSFRSMVNLKSLSVHLNGIEVVHEGAFEGLRVLEILDMSENRLRTLPESTFNSNHALTSLDLSSNHLHAIPKALLSQLASLRELFLNGNNLLELDQGTFAGSPEVNVLHLQGNSLRTIHPNAFTPLRNLTELKISDNFLRSIPQELMSSNHLLESLNLDGNLLSSIAEGAFANCRALRELSLQNNLLRSIPPGVVDASTELEELILDNNLLEDVKGLPSLFKLRHISLTRNQLRSLTPDLMPGSELTSISFGGNQLIRISDGAFANQPLITLLFLGDNELQSFGFKALEGLRSLERLYLQRNKLTRIEPDAFSSNSKALQFIDLSGNQLTSIQGLFSSLPFLEELNLSENLVENLLPGTFANLRALRILDLSGNRLRQLDLSAPFAFSGINTLKLGSNNLKSYGQSDQGSPQMPLRELDLRDNNVTASSLEFLKFPSLEMLQLAGNDLSDIGDGTFKGFPNLGLIGLEQCRISHLTPDVFKGSPNLAIVHLSENYLSSIPERLFSKQNGVNSTGSGLRELHLRSNQVKDFPYTAFKNATSLEVLTLGSNRIPSLDMTKVNLPRLKQLDLSGNHIVEITSPGGGIGKNLESLEVIDLGGNNLTSIPADIFNGLKLTQVNLGGNLFNRIPPSFSSNGFQGGFLLNVSGNPLAGIFVPGSVHFPVLDLYLVEVGLSSLGPDELKSFPDLHRLLIRRNPLKSLPGGVFRGMERLNLLDLGGNELEKLGVDAFQGLGALKSLNLSWNGLKEIKGFHQDLAGLQDLDLSHNELTQLTSGLFSPLGSLVSLRLTGNRIATLPTHFLLAPMAKLTLLELSNNIIQIAPPELLSHLETRISYLRLEGNPLSCNCENKGLWEWLRDHPRFLVMTQRIPPLNSYGGISLYIGKDSSNLICEDPEELKGRSMLEDIDSDILCSSQSILKVEFQDVNSSSAIISWQGRTNTDVQGFLLAYRIANDPDDPIRTRESPATSTSFLLDDLKGDTAYQICIHSITANQTVIDISESLLKDSSLSKCVQVSTLSDGTSGESPMSLLQRRLGVVVGAFVGASFFLVLMVTLVCVKLRNRRRKRRHPQNGKVISEVGDLTLLGHGETPLGVNAHFGGLNGGQFFHHHHNHHHRTNGNGAGKNGHGGGGGVNGGGATPRSPQFLTYRNYHNGEYGIPNREELERL